jgi:hypothetical protein
MTRRDDDDAWEQGWDGHHEQQLRRLARLSLPQKLQWLEEAHRLVRQMAAAAARVGRRLGVERKDRP